MTPADKDLLGNAIVQIMLAASSQDDGDGAPPKGESAVPCSAIQRKQIEAEVLDLVREHSAALSRYAFTVTRDRTVVQDGIQEAFLRYFIARAGGQCMANPHSWLFRVLRNYIIDRKRKDQSLPAGDLDLAGQVVDPRQDLEEGYQVDEGFRCALASLSPREKECMQLRLEGFGYEEIAGLLKIRSGSVAAFLARGFKKLRNSDFLKGRQL